MSGKLTRGVTEVFVAAALGLCALAMAGCAAAPGAAQSSQVQVQPSADLSGALKDIHAEMVTLRQQNQQLTETVNSMVQETGNLRARVEEVKGDLNQVTQSFRARPGAAQGTAGQPDRGRALPADRVQHRGDPAAPAAVVGDSASGPVGDRGAAGGADRDGKDGISWRAKLVWYCICLAVGFVGGVVTALLVAAKNKAKAGLVIDRAASVEDALAGKGSQAKQ